MNNLTNHSQSPTRDSDLTVHILKTEIEMVRMSKWFTEAEKQSKITRFELMIANRKGAINEK